MLLQWMQECSQSGVIQTCGHVAVDMSCTHRGRRSALRRAYRQAMDTNCADGEGQKRESRCDAGLHLCEGVVGNSSTSRVGVEQLVESRAKTVEVQGRGSEGRGEGEAVRVDWGWGRRLAMLLLYPIGKARCHRHGSNALIFAL